jgi:hypothetical protein
MKSWASAAGLAAIVFFSAFVSAQTPTAVTSPGAAFGSLSGERLAGTDDIRPQGYEAFSISPDSKWLVFPSDRGNVLAPAYSSANAPAYELYDIEKRQPSSIGLSARVQALTAQGRGPLGRAGCWDSDSRRVFLPGDRILFVADLRSKPLQWDVSESVGLQEFRRYYDCKDASPDATSIVRTLARSPRQVDIVATANPGRVLASHSAPWHVGRIDIRFLTVSPNRERVSYVVTEYRGSFVAASKGYVLQLTSPSAQKPRQLSDRVIGPIRWSSDNAFAYACVTDARSGKAAIYRWRVSDEH